MKRQFEEIAEDQEEANTYPRSWDIAYSPKPREMMAYFGAFTDLWPVVRYASNVDTFIYVDGQPNSGYYDESKETMIDAIAKNAPNGVFNVVETSEDVVEFELGLDGTKIIYFMSTLSGDAMEHPLLGPMLRKTKYLFVQGYVPYPDLDLRLMTSLTYVESTVNCYSGQLKELHESGALKVKIINETSDEHSGDYGEEVEEIEHPEWKSYRTQCMASPTSNDYCWTREAI